jgi:putative hydrolase of the HAD superfamily
MNYGISFDFWNTLYGNGTESKRQKLRVGYFRKIIANYKKYNFKTVETAFSASMDLFLQNWQNKQRTPTPSERIQYMAKILGVDLNDNEVNQISEYFGNLIFKIPPENIHSVNTIVAQLAEKYPLGIISDTGYITGEYIRGFLEKERLLPYFRSLVFSDEQKYCKPHASVFQLTCNSLKVDCSRLIHIGDLEHTDVKGIKDAGGISIKFTGNNINISGNSQADYTIDSYDALPHLIDKIISG